MADESVNVKQDIGGDRIIDGESVTGHPDGTSFRQRVQIAGATLAAVTPVSTSAAPGDYGLVVRSPPNATAPGNFISKYLTDDGTASDGTNISSAADYSGAGAARFWRGPAADKLWVVTRMLIMIRDTGTFDAADYGNGITLTNGIGVDVWDDVADEVDLDLVDGLHVKFNAGWAQLCYDAEIKTWGTGDEFLVVRWTFEKAGKALLLDGAANQNISVYLNDNLSGLVSQTFLIQGYEIDA